MALKREGAALDSGRAMRTQELKLRIRARRLRRRPGRGRRGDAPPRPQSEAVVEPGRRLRDAGEPRARRPAVPRPPSRPTSAAPRPRPPSARRARRRRRARSPRRRTPRAPTPRRPAAARRPRRPSASGQRLEVDLAARRRRRARGGAASEARPSERSIIACTPARASARPSHRRGSGRRWRRVSSGGPLRPAVEDRKAGAGRAERARDADEVAGPRAAAAHERGLVVGPADDGDGERQHRRGRDVAADERDAVAPREARPSRRRARARRPRRSRRAGRARRTPRPDRRPSRARSDSAPASARCPASAAVAVTPRRKWTPSIIASVDVTASGARAHDGGVVAAADEHALGRRAEARPHGVDELELVHERTLARDAAPPGKDADRGGVAFSVEDAAGGDRRPRYRWR